MARRIDIVTTVDTEDLAAELATRLSNEHLLEFIINIDAQVADWNFTDSLIARFDNLRQERASEEDMKAVVEDIQAQTVFSSNRIFKTWKLMKKLLGVEDE